ATGGAGARRVRAAGDLRSGGDAAHRVRRLRAAAERGGARDRAAPDRPEDAPQAGALDGRAAAPQRAGAAAGGADGAGRAGQLRALPQPRGVAPDAAAGPLARGGRRDRAGGGRAAQRAHRDGPARGGAPGGGAGARPGRPRRPPRELRARNRAVTTRGGLRQRVRVELHDAGATQLWSDELLNQWLAEAISAYGHDLPKQAETTWTSVADQQEYALPSDYLAAVRVEHPDDYFRVYAPVAGGDVLEDVSGIPTRFRLSEQLTFDVYGGNLVLWPAPDVDGETIRLRYRALYAAPSADADVLATPSGDDELLVWWVAARALEWIGMDEARRQRVQPRVGAAPSGA